LAERARAPRFAPKFGIFLELGKARLSALVVLTAVVGFVLAARGPLDWGRLLWVCIGTALAALGANALNEHLERERDRRMLRTRRRPLPSGRLEPQHAVCFGLGAGVLGSALLAVYVNAVAGLLASAATLLYVLVYTPLKTRTAASTLVGAVVGALPPLIGWSGAHGRLDPGAWGLAGVLLVWQIPHFLSLAWMYRVDYNRGGFRLLPVVDQSGALTACVVVVYALLLVVMSLSLVWAGELGFVYAGGALALGAGLVVLCVQLERRPSVSAARRVFVASIIYLPLLLGLMVMDRAVAQYWHRTGYPRLATDRLGVSRVDIPVHSAEQTRNQTPAAVNG
jgi:protoheme IX farnesyltransferase